MPRATADDKRKLLDEIEKCADIELNQLGRGLRERLYALSVFDLRCLERAFKLTYQEGFNRGENRQNW